jgi:phosphate transport system substrate-binding protein
MLEDKEIMRITEFQGPNPKQICLGNLRHWRYLENRYVPPSPLTGEGRGEGEQAGGVVSYRFGHWILKFRNYLGFGNLDLGALFLYLLTLVLVTAGGVGCQKAGAGITVAGSTSVEPFAELLAEEYMSAHHGLRVYVQGGGSTAGIKAVQTHAAQIGMSSRSLMDDEKALHSVTIAKDAIAVIVNPRNPVGDITLEQIREIFTGKVRRWADVGGLPYPIVLVTREEGSGTREAFQKLVMQKEEVSFESLVQDSNGAIRQVVASDPNAIGYISLGLVNEKVKALKISGLEPTVANIEKGRYTLVRPFLFVFDQEPTGEAKSFLEFVLSPRAQRLLSREGLVPILPNLSGG